MKKSLVVLLLAAACIVARAQGGLPKVTAVDPNTAKVGDVISVTGENLAKDSVGKVYLTDNKTDLQVEVTEQNATSIKFKIPAKASGRMSLMFLTVEAEPKLMQLPVKVTIEAAP